MHRFQLDGAKLTRKESVPKGEGRGGPRGKSHFRSGLSLDPQRKVLYSLDIDQGTISALDLEAEKELKSAKAGIRPYDVALPATATCSTSPTGPVARSTSSIRLTSARSRGSPSASIPTSLPLPPRMTGFSSPVHRATPSR